MAEEVEEETPQNTQGMEVEQLEPVNETLPDRQRRSSQDSHPCFFSQSQKPEEKKDTENEVNYSISLQDKNDKQHLQNREVWVKTALKCHWVEKFGEQISFPCVSFFLCLI